MNLILSKLPQQAIALIGIGVLMLVAGISITSYFTDQPYMIDGKEFGFGGIAKKTAELSTCKALLSQEFTENEQLRRSNLNLQAEQKARIAHDADLWFPIEEFTFAKDGSFVSSNQKRSGKGKWTHTDSPITLTLDEIRGTTEVILLTNLPPPSNKIRLSKNRTILVPWDDLEYQLTLTSSLYDSADIRVERRSKPQSQAASQ